MFFAARGVEMPARGRDEGLGDCGMGYILGARSAGSGAHRRLLLPL
jgi:hypothetical protein